MIEKGGAMLLAGTTTAFSPGGGITGILAQIEAMVALNSRKWKQPN
jgi:hypothetical protein